MTRVAVLGAGELAAQLGAEFALGGCSVTWPGGPPSAFEDALRLASAHGLAGPAELERARALAAGQGGAEARIALIVEAGEDPAAAAGDLGALAAAHPEALAATATPGARLTELAQAAGVGGRMVALGYGRPALLSPVVELLAARDTPPRLLDRVSQLLRAIGKRPIPLRRELGGTVSERIELAVVRECVALVERGVADAAQIDAIVRDGLARAWAAAGPLGQAALEGPARLTRLEDAGLDGLERALGSLEDVRARRSRRDEALAAAVRAERARPAAGEL